MQSERIFTDRRFFSDVYAPAFVHIVGVKHVSTVDVYVAKRIQSVKDEIEMLFCKRILIQQKGRRHFAILLGKDGRRLFVEPLVGIRDLLIIEQNGIQRAGRFTSVGFVFVMQGPSGNLLGDQNKHSPLQMD